MRILSKGFAGIAILAGAALAGGAAAAAPNNAAAAFDKLRELTGTWELQNGKNMKATMTIELTAAGSALLERFVMTGPEGPGEMITMFYLDGDKLKLTHYCEAKNQPTMAGKYSPETNTLTFDFVSATNLKSLNDGHMHHAVYKFIDKDHFQTIWTFRKDQKDAGTEDMTFVRTR